MTTKPNPLRGKNAIEAAVFAVTLMEPIDQMAMSAVVDAIQAKFQDDLPGEERPQTISLAIGPGASMPVQTHSVGGIHRFLTKNDGQLVWSLRVDATGMQVACFDYTDYKSVSEKALSYLSFSLEAIGHSLPVGELAFHVIDKFLYPLQCEDSDLNRDNLFRQNTDYLTGKTHSTGRYWHVFQGWFDDYTDDLHILNQLNINSTKILPTGNTGVFIDHRISLRTISGEKAFDSSAIDKGDGLLEGLKKIFYKLHQKNSYAIRGLLTDEMLQAVGMEDK